MAQFLRFSSIAAAFACEYAAATLSSWFLHLVASALFYWALRQRFNGLVSLAGLLAVALLPGYGLAVLGLVWAGLRWGPGLSGDLLSEFRDHVAPRLEHKQTAIADLPLVDHLQVQPLIDLLDSPDLEIRKAVLEAMARRRGRRLIECIQRALNDPKPEIYQLAVAKLAQIQEDHSQQLAQARELYGRDRSRDSAFGLARAYQDYLDSGLLDTAMEPLYLEQLAEVYAEISNDVTAGLQRGQILLRLGRPQQARQQYQAVLQLDAQCAEARLGLVEVCYAERDWGGLRAELPQLNSLAAKLPPEMRTHLEWLCR